MFPEPIAGLVIRYAFLWHDEHLKGQEEGRKDRPCAIILVTQEDEGDKLVTVLPITHAQPHDPTLAVELPALTKQRLGLDEARSWVLLNEANRFAWPGPDLRPIQWEYLESVAYGALPADFFRKIRAQFIEVLKAKKARNVTRSS